MPASRRKDRSRLDGFETEIFQLVRKHATEGQWMSWLRAPLEHAAAQGDMELFTRLMDAGADGGAGWRGCHGRTLLGAAAHGKSVEMVLTLFESGAKADVNATFGDWQESALHVAAAHGAEQVSTELLLAGADPNVLDRAKRSPLHLAGKAGHDGVVDILLNLGADPNGSSRKSGRETPLHLAAKEGHGLCVSKLLVGGADKESPGRNGCSPLHVAAQFNRLGAVEELLAAGANVDPRQQSFPLYSALEIAVIGGHVEVVRVLLKHGSSFKAYGDMGYTMGYTALHRAFDGGHGPHGDHGDVVRALIEAGADIEAKTTDYGLTPLHLAALKDSSGGIRALLEGGANINARSGDGYTPLHDACYQSYVDCVEILLRWGADDKLTDASRETAEDVVGEWERNGEEEDAESEQRKADDERIRWMLARAPADRSWRRRGWLVMARSFPAKVQLAMERNSGGGGGSRGSSDDAVGGSSGTLGQTKTDPERLVNRVVGLDVEGIFRLVVGFL